MKNIPIGYVIAGVATLLFGMFAIFMMTFVSYVPPGYCGVVVELVRSDDNVRAEPLGAGYHWVGAMTEVWQFPLFEQTVSWEGLDQFQLQTSEGMTLGAAVGVTFNIDPHHVPQLFRKYRSGIDEITHRFMRNYLRDALTIAASSRQIHDLYGSGKEQFLVDVENRVKDTLKDIGINVSRVYLVESFKFPSSVLNALNMKIEAAQRAEQRENELREAEAQARKEVAKAEGEASSKLAAARGKAESVRLQAQADAEASLLIAEAEAKGNLLLAESLTEELLLQRLIEQWDGKIPPVITGGALPLLNADALLNH